MSDVAAVRDRKVVANIVKTHKFFRAGALVSIRLVHWMGKRSRVLVYGMTRGGRRVESYLSLEYLDRFRTKWAPHAVEDAADFREPTEALCADLVKLKETL